MKYGNSENSGAKPLNLSGADTSIVYKTMPEKDKPSVDASVTAKALDDAAYKTFGTDKNKPKVDAATLKVSHEVFKTY
jgi:hypothetical protein